MFSCQRTRESQSAGPLPLPSDRPCLSPPTSPFWDAFSFRKPALEPEFEWQVLQKPCIRRASGYCVSERGATLGRSEQPLAALLRALRCQASTFSLSSPFEARGAKSCRLQQGRLPRLQNSAGRSRGSMASGSDEFESAHFSQLLTQSRGCQFASTEAEKRGLCARKRL